MGATDGDSGATKGTHMGPRRARLLSAWRRERGAWTNCKRFQRKDDILQEISSKSPDPWIDYKEVASDSAIHEYNARKSRAGARGSWLNCEEVSGGG
eukprot:122645-Pyramimonas_sp.AAC.1